MMKKKYTQRKEQTKWNIYILIEFDCMYFCPNGNSNEKDIFYRLYLSLGLPSSSMHLEYRPL